MNAMLGMMIFDHYWWLVLPGMLLGVYAQIRLSSVYSKYIQVPTESGISGAQAARMILDRAGLSGVPVEEVPGQLSDHYDPTTRTLRLSSQNYQGRTIAAVGVAAHEAGHALQHQAAYAPLHIRMKLVPITQFASTAAMWISFGGYMFGMAKLAWLGLIVFGIIAIFQLVTLPVEFDASSRAKRQLAGMGIVTRDEEYGVSKVLGAAALTYVAAMVSSLMTVLHLFLIARNSDRD